MLGLRGAKKRDDPSLAIKPGDLDGAVRILSVSKAQFHSYTKEWTLQYSAYVELTNCPCCGQPRGAGSLHP